MNSVATMSKQERAELFRATAERLQIHDVNVEKDFWVCWLLKELFTIPEFKDRFVFKGGTSLSKCFNLIQRFSEDIDIAVEYERLGFVDDRDPRRADLSHTKRRQLLDEMLEVCREYIGGSFISVLRRRVAELLGDDGWELKVSSNYPNTVEFEYPSALDTQLAYIRPLVVLEMGTHAEPIPREDVSIQPLAAEKYPDVFDEPACTVTTVVARRTFWEKATILHAEYHRPLEKQLPPNYSRHYADTAAMATATVKDEALADLNLLESVCIHKDRFYHCGWAKYLDAKPGSFHLSPRDERLRALEHDFRAMRVMYFREAPSFDDVLKQLADLERDINRL